MISVQFNAGLDGLIAQLQAQLREVDLCGHATLASAHVLFNHLG